MHSLSLSLPTCLKFLKPDQLASSAKSAINFSKKRGNVIMERKYSVHSCPVGYSLGHDGDECRVTSYQDGSAFCRTCNTLYPSVTGHSQIRGILSALALVASRHGYSKPPTIDVQGQTVTFFQPLDSSERNGVVLLINLDTFDLPEFRNASNVQSSCPLPVNDVPQSVMDAAKKLQELGFSLHKSPVYEVFPPIYSAQEGGVSIMLSYYPTNH